MLALQVEDDAFGDGVLVFDDEDVRGRLAHVRLPLSGSVTTKRVPGRPSCEKACTLPFISFTSPITMDRPKPGAAAAAGDLLPNLVEAIEHLRELLVRDADAVVLDLDPDVLFHRR